MVALNTRKISPDNVHLKYGDDKWKKTTDSTEHVHVSVKNTQIGKYRGI